MQAFGGKAGDAFPESWLEPFGKRQHDFDARLLAEPEPESPADRVFRELGLAA